MELRRSPQPQSDLAMSRPWPSVAAETIPQAPLMLLLLLCCCFGGGGGAYGGTVAVRHCLVQAPEGPGHHDSHWAFSIIFCGLEPFTDMKICTFLYSSLVNHVGKYFYIFIEILSRGSVFYIKNHTYPIKTSFSRNFYHGGMKYSPAGVYFTEKSYLPCRSDFTNFLQGI